jgi:hypothetical protein
VSGHFLRVIERAAVGEVGRDSSCTERVTTDFRRAAAARRQIMRKASGWLIA